MRILEAVAVLSLLTAGQASATEQSWHERYLRGVRLVEEGKGKEARLELEKAFAARPESGLQVHTSGVRYIDYLPHLYLAAASHMSGDVAAARKHLQAAENDGVEGTSPAGQSLLRTYRKLLVAEGGAGSPSPGQVDKPKYRDFARKGTTLSDTAYADLRREVLSRCQLRQDTDVKQAPWYFHYELGRELIDKGDPQRALDAFIDAASVRARPQKNARIYGMWQTDYFPYFQIARAHAKLQNWDCAQDALAVSQREGEMAATDREFNELRALVLDTVKKESR